jgi:uncharacterized damage-inducible protein DinB
MSAFHVLAAALDELAAAIRPLTAAQFTGRIRASSGSIGGHVRHCLDHVEALERALDRGVCCYDDRVRGTAVEDDPAVACARLAACRMRLAALDPAMLARPLALSARISTDGVTVHAPSTVGREVAFVISHTVHHAALVAVLLEDLGIAVPARFGLAPTTPTRPAAVRLIPAGVTAGAPVHRALDGAVACAR